MAVLIGLVFCLYLYTNKVIGDFNSIDTPQIVDVVYTTDKVSFSWTKVEYATSYRIYSRPKNGDWKLIEAVANKQLKWEKELNGEHPEYSVMAVYTSPVGDKCLISKYSPVASCSDTELTEAQ